MKCSTKKRAKFVYYKHSIKNVYCLHIWRVFIHSFFCLHFIINLFTRFLFYISLNHINDVYLFRLTSSRHVSLFLISHLFLFYSQLISFWFTFHFILIYFSSYFHHNLFIMTRQKQMFIKTFAKKIIIKKMSAKTTKSANRSTTTRKKALTAEDEQILSYHWLY